jgi:hypothetical protein
MKFIVIISILICSCSNSKLESLERKNAQLEMDCRHLAGMIRQRDTLIMNFQNSIIRIQLIAGIKNPDNVFTYNEKILNKIDAKAVLKSHKRRNKNQLKEHRATGSDPFYGL